MNLVGRAAQAERGVGADNTPERRQQSVAAARRLGRRVSARRELFRALELNSADEQYVRCLTQIMLWEGDAAGVSFTAPICRGILARS